MAIKAVREKRMGWLRAFGMFNVPQATKKMQTLSIQEYKHSRQREKKLGRF